MPSAVHIRTGARLHFGPFAVAEDSGVFGGIGLMVEEPGCELSVAASPADHYIGPPEWTDRVAEVIGRLRDRGIAAQDTGIAVRIAAMVPQHAGLGSGTQLALAVAAGVAGLCGRPESAHPLQLAAMIGRGRRSAIGIHGFAVGGFLVDGGKPSDDVIGSLETRLPFPDDWPVLLWTPHAVGGLSGDVERTAFHSLPPMSSSTTRRLRSIIGDRLLPALRSKRHAEFAAALNDYGDGVGAHFAPVQGGVYSHSRAEPLVRWLRSSGVAGVAQTSWGPTIAALLPDPATAADVVARCPCPPGELRLTRALNRGADVTAAPPGFPR
jgi:beta-RFAP synthase